ncbi:MAG: SDR family NAD(P)-dependent oxidoreductase [Pseudomonadota bacterium]
MDAQFLKNYKPVKHLLKDKIILVTGAGSGIGKSVSVAYAKHGATVILMSKTIKNLEIVYDEIMASGYTEPSIYPLNFKGATQEDFLKLHDSINKEYGRLDGLLNNAAQVGGLRPIKLLEPHDWESLTRINLHSPFLLTQNCIPLLEKSEDPSILFSIDHKTKAYWGAYGISKYAQIGLIKILSEELSGEQYIRVNGIDPGAIRTNLRIHNYPGEDPNEMVSADSITSSYIYFMGKDSAEITGQNICLQDA